MEIGGYIYDVLMDVSIASSFLPLIISVIHYRHLNELLRPLFILFVISGVIEITNKVHLEIGVNNLYIFHIFTVLEFTLISLFYSRFFKRYFNSILIKIPIILFLGVCVVDYAINGFKFIDSFSISIESIVLIFYSLLLFYLVLKNLVFDNLLAAPVFWINTAILVYFSGNLVLFVFSNYMMANSNNTHFILWALIHSFLNIVYNILLSFGFWKTKLI
jgi:hypothetical protein